MKNLESITKKYDSLEYNQNVYGVGGGLTQNSFSSNRHENAKTDNGKMTFGKTCQIFKKATGVELKHVKNIIQTAFPNMEWHHAGMLPKNYGGGMKKTYFLNSEEIVDLAKNWDKYYNAYFFEKNKETSRVTFLNTFATYVTCSEEPSFFIYKTTLMEGKYGYFEADYKYNLPTYTAGWKFYNEKYYNAYKNEEYTINKSDLETVFVKKSRNIYFETQRFKFNENQGKIVTKATYRKNIKRIEQENKAADEQKEIIAKQKTEVLRLVNSAKLKAEEFIKETIAANKQAKLKEMLKGGTIESKMVVFFENEIHPAPQEIFDFKNSSGKSWNALRNLYKNK